MTVSVIRFIEIGNWKETKVQKKWEVKTSHNGKKKMEKVFNFGPFGIFAFHHMLHNADLKCRMKRYLREQLPI